MGWLAGWDKRLKLTIDSDDVTAALANFPVLVYISAASGIGDVDASCVFDEVGANSLKIAVTKSDGTTECYVEVEKWDSANEKAWLWVKVPSIASDADTILYLYYDNDHANNTSYVGAPNSAVAENVWDSNFYLVTHMRDDPDTSHTRDSTTNDLDGTKAGANKPIVTTSGVIAGDAQDWAEGDDEDIDHGNMTGLDGVSAFTFEFWLNKDALPFVGVEGILGRGSGGQRVPWIYGNAGTSTTRIHFETDNGGGDGNVVSANLTAGTPCHVVFAWDGSNVVAHVNGTAGNSDATGGSVLQDTDGALTLGYVIYAGGWLRNAVLDEVRVSLNRRPIAWIKATYESGRDDFITFGSEEVVTTATKDLACSFFVQVSSGSADLPAELTIRKPDSEALAAEFTIRRPESEALAAELEIRRSTSVALPAGLTARQLVTQDLAGELVVRHTASTELLGRFDIRRDGSASLGAGFSIRRNATAELAADLTVRQLATVDLLGELTVRHNGSQNLLGGFSVRRSSSQSLAAGFLPSNPGSQDLACKLDVFHPGETLDLLGYFSVRRPGILLDITLEERDVAISLEERNVEITLQERDIAIALGERDVAITLEERGIAISFRHEGQTMVNLGDTFQLKGECTDLDGAAEDPDSQSIKLYDVEDTLIDTDTNPTAGTPTGEFYANLEAKSTGVTGAWIVLWEVTKGVEKRTVRFDVEVKSLLG